ncbi:NAD(P)/FAD-dependent oxidoreductase [Kiloniella sp. b19]|uniref:NAD(P)/FAD-dependent oxidoreductase n=1 Tax=Kiloniella sp. GXU_MW_B19 TaxID=3141326 RepID=UPI0031D88687
MGDNTIKGTVIVGAGQAALSCSSKLRALGYEKPITLIGEEDFPPYQRPPLSKAYLLNETGREDLFLRPSSFYEDQNISLKLGQRVEAIDPAAKSLTVGGDVVEYENLVLATGTTPRRLPAAAGGDLGNCFTIRSIADIDRLAPHVRKGQRLLVIGGGYIGLEVAAVAVKLGLEVTLVEASERILQRVAAPETSDYFRKLHSERGVRILESTSLERLEGEGTVSGATLANGETLAADFVVLGIGVTANAELAEQAGLSVENGIRTNEKGQTSDPSIWSIGDCASFPHERGQIRLESVGHAIDHGNLVAANIMEQDKSYVAKPWFWSDQYEVKLQIAGLNTGYDNVVVRKSDDIVQSVWYYEGDRLLAVDAMNDARAYMVGKRLIESGKSPSKDMVSDLSIDLKALLKA